MFRRSTSLFLGKPCPNTFLKSMTSAGFTSYFGVPDSLLKEFCRCVTWHGENKAQSDVGVEHHVIAANEGNAIGLATGYFLASSRIPVVYMQNSGLGNCINPLTSICHSEVYSIPMILLIGWRGRPGSKSDEPQHKAMGRLTEAVLNASEVPYTVLGTEEGAMDAAIAKAMAHFKSARTPFAILVDRDTFGPVPDFCKGTGEAEPKDVKLGREEAIQQILSQIPTTTPVVGTTGMISREIFETRLRLKQSNASDFLTVGAMGHASSIALGVALGQQSQSVGGAAAAASAASTSTTTTPTPSDATSDSAAKENFGRKVVCIDGDGAFLMHLGAAAIAGSGGASVPSNLMHIVLNNGAHDSVGGQPTVGFHCDLTAIAKSCGYTVIPPVMDLDDLDTAISEVNNFITGVNNAGDKPLFLEIQCKKGNRADLGRPTSSAAENCEAFMKFVQTTSAGTPAIPQAEGKSAKK